MLIRGLPTGRQAAQDEGVENLTDSSSDPCKGRIVSNFSERVSFIWSVADLLRGPYKPAQYGKVILPLTVLRRLDCVLEPTKQKVLDKAAALKASGIKDIEPILNKAAGQKFHNTSKLDFQRLKGDPEVAQSYRNSSDEDRDRLMMCPASKRRVCSFDMAEVPPA